MKGHIRERTPGTWELFVDLGKDEYGKRKRKTKTVKGNKTQAQKELNKLLAEVESGAVTRKSTTMTLGDYMDYWLALKRKEVSYRTAVSYGDVIKAIKNDKISKTKLSDLMPIMIQKYLDSRTDLKAATVRRHLTVIKQALKDAVALELAARNPASALKPPKAEKTSYSILNTEQVDYILKETKGLPVRAAILLATRLGLRSGEACGLKWSDINFDKKAVTIRRTIKRADLGERQFGIHGIGPTKNSKIRDIALGESLIKELKKIKEQQENWAKELKLPVEHFEFVCCLEDGRPLTPDYIVKYYKKAIREIGMPDETRFHDLRHYFATTLLEAGVNPKVVSEILGHANINITLDVYSHVSIDLQLEAIAHLDKELE